MGTTLELAEVYGDIPIADKQNYEGLGIIDGATIPHMNKKATNKRLGSIRGTANHIFFMTATAL